MKSKKRKARSSVHSDTFRKAIRVAGARNSPCISDHVHLAPALAAVIRGLTDIEVREAIRAYESAIIRATSIESQVRYICLAIMAYAVMMRGVHTAWRYTYPPLLKQCARYSGTGAKYYVDDLRVFCEAALANTWPEVAA
jgi:hypothetical protein